MMDKNVTPVRTFYRRVPVLKNLRSLYSLGATTSFSSVSNLATHRHQQNLRGKQFKNPTRQLGSSREPRVPRPFGDYREAPLLPPKNACAIVFTQSSTVHFPIV